MIKLIFIPILVIIYLLIINQEEKKNEQYLFNNVNDNKYSVKTITSIKPYDDNTRYLATSHPYCNKISIIDISIKPYLVKNSELYFSDYDDKFYSYGCLIYSQTNNMLNYHDSYSRVNAFILLGLSISEYAN